MRGLKINFDKGQISIDTNACVTNFDATVQNALVNIATRKGTDRIFPDKGTSILKNAVAGVIVGMNDANHEAQAAAIHTLFFSRKWDTTGDNTLKLGSVKMRPITYDGRTLVINAAFTDVAKTRTVGTITTL